MVFWSFFKFRVYFGHLLGFGGFGHLLGLRDILVIFSSFGAYLMISGVFWSFLGYFIGILLIFEIFGYFGHFSGFFKHNW